MSPAKRFLLSLPSGAGLLAALLGAAAASGSPEPATGDPQLLIVPDTPKATFVLERSDARTLARYDSFTLVEATPDDAARLRSSGADRRDDLRQVRLAAGAFDPVTDRASLAGKQAGDQGGLALVQFIGPVKQRWLELLGATGVRIVGYQAQDAYLVHGTADQLARVGDLLGSDPAVRAAARVEPRDKVEPGTSAPGSRRLAVQTIAGEPGEGARARAAAAGRELRPESTVPGLRTQYLELDGGEAAALARDPGVVAIEPSPEPRQRDERAAQIVAGNVSSGTPTGPGYLSFLTSTGFPGTTLPFTIDVSDGGLDSGTDPPAHPDFFEDGSTANPDRVAYLANWTADSDARDCSGHGTNVASIAAGYDDHGGPLAEDSVGYNYGLGVAPRATIGASKVFRCSNAFDTGGSSLTSVAANAYAGGARISNNSWGSAVRGDYTADSQEFDRLVRDARPTGSPGNQELVEVMSAGNEGDNGYGSIGSPATAKNVITVGASESVRAIGGTDGCLVPDTGANNADDIIDFSSRGPTDDGRRKPDLVAPGTHVTGASPQNSDYASDGDGTCNPKFPSGSPVYSLASGTSQATPGVTGAAALVLDWYRREHGGGSDLPSPALTKALLLNTATDIEGGDSGKGSLIDAAPNTDQGWGRVNMGRVLDGTARELYDQTDVIENTGDSVTRAFAVQNNAEPVKLTLAYTDRFGPATGNSFVNDLDLVVEAGGRTYKGNVFAEGVSITGGSADPRNNVESVYLPPGTDGPFAVRVIGKNIAGNGLPADGGPEDPTDQDFALVVSNAAEQPSPVLVADGTTLVDAEGDGAVEPNEAFTLTQRIRNAGTDTATGIGGTLSPVSAGVSVSQPASAYGDLAPDATATNTTPFEGSLDGTASCGQDAQLALALTTDQGPQTVPVTVPTGGSRPVISLGSADVPRTIPDNSAGGVGSTLNVTTTGRLKDVNVRIGALTHTFVGDLKLELVAPDGTVVTLAEHPGGPDNPGKDFKNTVFDDSAATNIGAGAPPYTGSFKPQADQLARLNGKLAQGTWTLRVRDLFDSDKGTLTSWGLDIRTAACGDITAPQTTLGSGPSGTTRSRSASFSFSSNEPGTFQCKFDAGSFATCGSPKAYSGLADGSHTFSVRARDSAGNLDASPVTRQWKIDGTPPVISLSSPAARTTDTTPRLSGRAGIAPGDSTFVTLRLWRGSGTAGSPVQTLTAMRGSDGSYAASAATLPAGVYTAQAEQADSLGNRRRTPARTFVVDFPPLGWAVRPRERDLRSTLSGGVPILAACTGVCDVATSLSVSERTASRLDLAATRVGDSTTAFSGAAAKRLAVRLGTAPRRRIGSADRVRLVVSIVVSDASRRLAPQARTLSLRRRGTLRRAKKRGVRSWLDCAAACSATARLYISKRQSKALGLSARKRVAASGKASLDGGGSVGLTSKLKRSIRRRLDGVRRLRGTLRVTVTDATGTKRRASMRVTLR